jgi:mannose-6-phosphate isomerase-like protein (cupin superfamily)
VEVKKKIGSEKTWIFNDGSQPIQLRMKISVEGNVVELAKDDLIVVEPGERHHIIEQSPDLLLLLLMPPPVPDDKEVI